MRALILFSFLFIGCVGTPKVQYMKPDSPAEVEVRRTQMLGRWLGEAPTLDGKFYRWVMERRADGGYTLSTMLKDQGKIVEKNTEIGLWGVAGSVYFTMTREMIHEGKIRALDTTTAVYYDAYEIQFFDGSEFRYKNVDTQNVYSVRRVPDNFKLE